MFHRLNQWRLAKARFLFQWGRPPGRAFYIRITPHFGFGIPWFSDNTGGVKRLRRIRYSPYHGLQIVKWVRPSWYVERQVWGSSKIKGGDNLLNDHRKR
jgi:hypothetical protein